MLSHSRWWEYLRGTICCFDSYCKVLERNEFASIYFINFLMTGADIFQALCFLLYKKKKGNKLVRLLCFKYWRWQVCVRLLLGLVEYVKALVPLVKRTRCLRRQALVSKPLPFWMILQSISGQFHQIPQHKFKAIFVIVLRRGQYSQNLNSSYWGLMAISV